MIQLNKAEKVYDNGTEALRGVDLRIDDGELVFLMGPNGSGKSTLTKILTAEERASGGQVAVNGYRLDNIKQWQIPYMRRTIGVVFQDFRLIEKKTVRQNIEFVMRIVGASRREMRKRIPYVLDLVSLTHKIDAYPDQLSGGEQQRVAIARALANNPKMIIADEPTGNLDPLLKQELLQLLVKINETGTTMLVVSHEGDLVRKLASEHNKRVVTLKNGRIASDTQGGPAEK